MFNPYILLIFLSVAIAAVSQVLLKKAAGKHYGSKLREYANPWVMGGYGLLLATTLINIYAYSKGVQLKSGAIIESLGFVLVMILSRVIFGEKITGRKLAGNALIIAGIILFHL